ncbi:spore germination protein GerPE [Metabacillus sp. RGM 3146]|uniref:spore germination protein GerPE n=1 Tax=Metabacillus sp. RGM 3146 TaxID=3401092 RepID=UPI003B9A546D
MKAAYVNVMGISSVFNIGDSDAITPRTKIFAVQREAEIFYDGEGDFSQYEIFNTPLIKPVKNETVNTSFCNEKHAINVQYVKVLALSSSAVFHIGSSNLVDAVARIKHTRQLLSTDET